MKVIVPGQLHDYTQGRAVIEGRGETLAAVLGDLDRVYPGLRFRVVDEQGRVRQHIRLFVNRQPSGSLERPVSESDEILIVAALSGG